MDFEPTTKKRPMTIYYSLVIPFKNEERNVVPLIEELFPIMETLGEPWELIAIDDGSKDRTLDILKTLKKHYPNLRILSFDSNYGQSSGFDAGFKAAKGAWVITLDGDLQNDPKDIPKLCRLRHQYDLVCGRRIGRKDTLLKRLTSKIANAVRQWVCEDGVHDTGCSLKVYRKKALDEIKLFHGMHRFLPALFKIGGFRVIEIDVNHRGRRAGKSNYTAFNRSFNTIYDLLAVAWMKKRRLVYQIKERIEG